MAIPEITLYFPPDVDNSRQFHIWEERREELVHLFGHYLLMLTEAELIKKFENWESKLKELQYSDRGNNYLLALLYISILHYFTRSVDLIRANLNFMRKLLETKNRTQIMCAAQTFAWCASENQECIDFMRELLTRASKWITSQNTAFSALHVLFTAGNFLLPNVYEETTNNYKQLCTWLSCDDVNLQVMSAKVLQLHFKALKTNISQVNTLFSECLHKISTQSQNLYGSIRVIDNILQYYQNPNQAMEVFELVEQFPYLKYENLSFTWFFTLMKIVENKFLAIIITPDSAPRLLSTLFASCKKFMSIRLYEMLFRFFKALNPSTFRSYLPNVIDFLANTVTEHRYPQICAIAFDSLSYLIDTFPNCIIFSPSFFLNAEPSPQYVCALRKSMRIFSDLKSTLVNKFREGISPRATIDQQILALTIFSQFTSHIFDNIEGVFDTISYLVKSPSTNVRLLMVSILPIFHNKKALDDLLFLALFDTEKSVRAGAVSQLKASHLEQLQLLSQILTDPSYTVRRNAIKLVAQVAPANPMLFYVPITMLVQQTMISILTTSNPSVCQKISSLLPLIAQHLLSFCPSYIPQVIKVCYTFLCPEKYRTKDSKILSVIQRDMNHDGNLLISNTRPFDASCVNLNRVFEIENKHFIDKRDGDLFETLRCLSSHLGPYLDELMPIYLSVFSENRTELVYKSALNSLIEIVNKLEAASNIPSTQPTLPHTLITLLRAKPSEEVAILILKLLATFGITAYPRNNSVFDDGDENEYDFKSPSYYTDSMLSALVKILDEQHSCVFESVTSIFVYEHHQAVKFLAPIIKAYDKAIRSSKPKIRVQLFSQLEIICYYSGIRAASYAQTLTDLILDNISMPEALKVACVLSYFLKCEFIPYAPSIYQECTHILGMSKLGVSKELFRFLTYAVVFQNQPLDNFIFACEQRMLLKPSTDEITVMLNSLTTITHLSDVTFDCSRMARLCIPLLNSSIRPNVMQLLYSLVIFCHLNVEFLEFLLPDSDVGLPALKDYLAGKSLSIDAFITPMIIICHVDPPSFLPPPYNSFTRIFESFSAPPSNTEKWLEDLCKAVIGGSPQASIRACLQPAITSPEFRFEIFPVAFLSCWRDAPKETRVEFSKVMEAIYTDEVNRPEQIFLTLAELLLRAGVPFEISNFTLCEACLSPMQSCRFLAKYYNEFPNDTKAMEKMLELNTRLSRYHNSRGFLKLKCVDIPSIAKWNEKLGQWDAALHIYERDDPTNLPKILECYANLERWEDIRKLSDQFQYLSSEHKNETALWFAWASLKCNDFNDASSFMAYLNNDETNLETVLFKLIYFVKSDNQDAAVRLLKTSMQMLVSDCSIYSSLNANRADTNLIYANHFLELEEALNIRKAKSNKLPDIWARRLGYISGDSSSFMRLVEIRNLVASPTANRRTYLKLLSILVKERKWNLVDRFQPLVLEHIDSPQVQISYVKILWHRGKVTEAIDSIHLLNSIHSVTDKNMFMDSFSNVQQSVMDALSRVLSTKEFKVEPTPESFYSYACRARNLNTFTDKQRARMIRLEATWIGQEYAAEKIDVSLAMFAESSKIYANDYRTWANWAYTSAKAVDQDSNYKYVQMAMNGFLRASILHTSNTLEYLCQLFSLLFRYATKMSIQQDIFDKIRELLPPVIEQILPQIVCHISHIDEKVRSVVHSLIINIAAQHFQSVVYQIQLIANDQENEKNTIAHDILNKISLPHPELAKEASQMASGLSRSAVTYYDIWYARIDEAYHLELAGDHEGSMKKLRSMTQMRVNKQCKLDQIQLKSVDTQFNTVINAINKNPKTEYEIGQMWSPVRLFFQSIREKINKMDVVMLEMVSEYLAEKRNFKLSIPGTYTTTNSGPNISYIDTTLPVLTTQQHPRILYMHGSDGNKWKFLLKGNEDLRLDQRIMQFFNLINTLVMSNKVTQKNNITIINYAITPLAINAGLISWVTGADTMHQLITDHRRAQNKLASAENEILTNYVGNCGPSLLGVQKLEMWDKVSVDCPATDLREYFWAKASNPVAWLRCVDTFSLSTALMSMAGYVVGLGDRHPSNIMIQRKRGHVVHIDFGDSFEVTQTRPKMPEKVPFRLTRMIVNALGVSGTAGQFAVMCENVLYIMRKNKSSIFAQLEIFVHEPIFQSRDDQNKGNAIMNRVSMKLNGLDPSLEPGVDVTQELSVEEQASRLIAIAADHTRYVTHYDGWCPYW